MCCHGNYMYGGDHAHLCAHMQFGRWYWRKPQLGKKKKKKNSVIKMDNFGHILIETYRWKNEQARLQGVEKPSREDLFEIKALQKKIDTWDLTKLLWTNIPWP